MTNTLTRSQAKRWTLGAQAAAGLFVLGAVALGVIGLPAPRSGGAVDPTAGSPSGFPVADPGAPAGQDGRGQDPSDQRREINTVGLAARLALFDNAPVPVSNVVVETPPPGDQDPEAPIDTIGTIVKRVRYIGFINDPQSPHAFIRIDGKQRVVAQGGVARSGSDELPDLRVERINPRFIVLADSENRAKVDLASPSGQSITMIDGADVQVAPIAENGSLLTAEDEAKIAAMPPRQQPMARRRLERERRGLPPDKENRRPTPEPLVTVKSSFNRNNRSGGD